MKNAALFLIVLAATAVPALAVDLVADSVVVTPVEVASGGNVRVIWAGHVTGSGSVGGPFTVGFYLSPDSTVTTADVLLGEATESTAVNPGDTFGEASPGRRVTIPAATAVGSYFLGVLVDSGGVVPESNESNNAFATPLAVSEVGIPNLTVLSCVASPAVARPGDVVTLTWRGANNGTSVSVPFRWAAYLSTDDAIDPADDTLMAGPFGAAGWRAGYSSDDRVQSVTLPSNLPLGTYSLGIYLDVDNAVQESDENDNGASTSITVSTFPGVTLWLVPAAASTPGAGSSDWRSEIQVVNPTTATRTATLFYVAKGSSWPGVELSAPVAIGPHESHLFEDPLLDLNPTSGLLVVVLDGLGPLVTSRTYNLGEADATYGQGIPGTLLDGVSAPTDLILPMVHSVPGRFRTNLGLVQASAGWFQVQVTLYTPDGQVAAVKRYSQPAAYTQVNNVFADLGLGDLSVQGAWLDVKLTGGTPTYWTCYASIVDDQTGDPTFISPVEPE
jgi:hypothetical protein